MRLLRCSALALVGFGLAAMVWAALAPGSLSVNGITVSTDFIEKGGRTYVPLADVAKALNLTVQKNGSGYVLAPAGGANQVEGLRGKIGDVIRAPQFTFQVLKVVKDEHYKKQFGQGTVDAETGNTIVGIVIRVKNATKKEMGINPFGQNLTTLTDEDAHTYSSYTGGWADVPSGDHSLLPGATIDFALVYQVPSKAKLKDLVYEVDAMGVPGNPILRIALGDSTGG